MKAVWILCGTVLFLLVLGSIPFSVRFRLQKTLRIDIEICKIRVFTYPRETTTSVDLRKFTYKRHQKRLAKEAKKAARKQQKNAQKNKTVDSDACKKPKIAAAHETEAVGTWDRLREMTPLGRVNSTSV